MTKSELQQLFFQEIPLTQHLGLLVHVAHAGEIKIGFRLEENKNHKGTAFGGSQYAAGALSCYGLFLVGLRDHGILTNNIVISDGKISYKYPVSTDFTVQSFWSAGDRRDFFDRLKRKKKAKTSLSASISSDDKICAQFNGDFVAVLD
ncbi:MAG: YiiD C-terminal domain-containing protein [Bdellovibrionaceae bacterium]|nr:YiiD C-terminal domain-containing protein [Pseudobdellovibrionaceae bacterium]